MKAAAAAETGADRTATLTARAGRASYVARDKVKNVLCSPRQLLIFNYFFVCWLSCSQ